MREDLKIHAIFLTPRHPEQMLKGQNIPPIAATEAVASELLNVWGINLKLNVWGINFKLNV